MTAASAAGQRFIADGDYMWMEDMTRKTLGFSPRPAALTVVDCARSLLPV